MKRWATSISLVAAVLGGSPVQAEGSIAVVGAGVVCAIGNFQCIPSSVLSVDAATPSTGHVHYASQSGVTELIRLDCVDATLRSDADPDSKNVLRGSGRSSDGERWYLSVVSDSAGGGTFQLWRQDVPGEGVCGFAGGFFPGQVTQGLFLFTRA